MTNNKYYQKCITFGRAAEGLRADFQSQLIEMQWEIGFEYVRFHGIFHDDMAVYKEVSFSCSTGDSKSQKHFLRNFTKYREALYINGFSTFAFHEISSNFTGFYENKPQISHK